MSDTTITDPAARLAEVERLLAEEKGRREAAEATVRTLSGRSAPAGDGGGAAVPSSVPADAIRRIAHKSGLAEDVVRTYLPLLGAAFEELGRPVVQAMGGMADVLDDVTTRVTVKDWESNAEAAERIRQEHVQRGEFITRKQAHALVKAQRADDPKWLEQRVADEIAKRAAADGDRTAAATAATTEGGTGPGTQSAGPRPDKSSDKVPDVKTFAAMPLDKQRELLAGEVF